MRGDAFNPSVNNITNVMSLWESKREGSPLEIAKQRGRSDVVEMMEAAIRCK